MDDPPDDPAFGDRPADANEVCGYPAVAVEENPAVDGNFGPKAAERVLVGRRHEVGVNRSTVPGDRLGVPDTVQGATEPNARVDDDQNVDIGLGRCVAASPGSVKDNRYQAFPGGGHGARSELYGVVVAWPGHRQSSDAVLVERQAGCSRGFPERGVEGGGHPEKKAARL